MTTDVAKQNAIIVTGATGEAVSKQNAIIVTGARGLVVAKMNAIIIINTNPRRRGAGLLG